MFGAKVIPVNNTGVGDIESASVADFTSDDIGGWSTGTRGFWSNVSRDYSSSTLLKPFSLSLRPHFSSSVMRYDGRSGVDEQKGSIYPCLLLPADDPIGRNLDVQMIQQFYNWPFVAITMIHFRLLFFQATHHQFKENERDSLISFTVVTLVSLMILFVTQLFRKTIVKRFQGFDLTKLDNMAVLSICSCFATLLLILGFHDKHVLGDNSGETAVFHGHEGCTVLNEFLLYMMIVPYLLYCRCVYARPWAVYLSWVICFFTVLACLLLSTIHDHAKYSYPYEIGLVLISFVILVNKRSNRVSDCIFYNQFEDLKIKYNELSSQLENKQKEVVSQRYMMANTAHDMKTPILATISGCELISEMVMENQPNHSPGVVSTTDSLQKQQQVAFKETINDIINVNKFLLVSINRCMDYAKTADGIKLMPKYETCHVEESIRTVLHCLPSAEDKEKVRFTLQSAAMCSHILTDKQWMQENILCLVSNAVKFTPQGVIDLRVSLTNDDGEVNVLFEVEDNGVGISKEMQSKLFAPFQQAQKNAGGTGLGLYSLSQRIQALGGKYGVRDRLDGKQGSLFWFNFPYRPDAITASMTRWDSGIIPLSSHSSSQKPVWSSMAAVYPTPTAVKKRPSRDGNDEEVTNIFPRSADESWLKCDSSESNETVAPAARFRQAATSTTSSNIPIVSVPKVVDDFKKNSSIVTKSPPKYRVLLADDSKAIRSVLVKILHRGGHEVVSVTNGLEAMQIIESNETEGQNFDAVILDLHMPVLDGFETMKRIREQEQIRKLDIESFDDGSYTHPKQFIIGCSANNDAETWSEMKECGANAVLLKPFTLAQFELCMADRFKSESPSF